MNTSISKTCWFLCKKCGHEQYGKHLEGKILTEKCKNCSADKSQFKLLEKY